MLLDTELRLGQACTEHGDCDCSARDDLWLVVGEVWLNESGDYEAKVHGMTDSRGRAWFPTKSTKLKCELALIGRAQELESETTLPLARFIH